MAPSPSARSNSRFSRSASVSESTASIKRCTTSETEEAYENFLESAILKRAVKSHGMMVMNPTYSSDCQRNYVSKRASGSPLTSTLLDNVVSWTKLTGIPTSVTVYFDDQVFHLHKFPLITRSGFIKRMLANWREVRIPSNCPGGVDTFETVANFCYGSTIRMDASNIAALRCAAEFLEMGEEHGKGNLIERCDRYLDQVALQNWEDTMLVLLYCQSLLPYAEDIQLVGRCIEALSFMACMEMLEPVERPGTRPVLSNGTQTLSSTITSKITEPESSETWWMEDLRRLPCGMFEQVIDSIRRQGMEEKYVSEAIVKFVDRWVFTNLEAEPDAALESNPSIEEPCKQAVAHASHKNLVEAVVRVLPPEKADVPTSFLFSLLRCALACGATKECRKQLETRISSQLELATVTDFFQPLKDSCISAAEVVSMKRIVNTFIAQQRGLNEHNIKLRNVSEEDVPENSYCQYAVSAVASIWDEYLIEVARDASLAPARFLELAQVMPPYARATHDHLYRALHVYLKAHPQLPQGDRQAVCRVLNCLKLSQETCTHAVQNDLMPLRTIVQAMFMQQLQTRNVLKANLPSNAATPSEGRSLSRSTGSSFRKKNSANLEHPTSDSPRFAHEGGPAMAQPSSDDDVDEDDGGVAVSSGFNPKRDAAFRQATLLKADYEATETRLRSLEAELATMRGRMEGGGPQERQFRRGHSFAGGDRRSRRKILADQGTSGSEEASRSSGKVAPPSRGPVGFIAKAFRMFAFGSRDLFVRSFFPGGRSWCTGKGQFQDPGHGRPSVSGKVKSRERVERREGRHRRYESFS